MRIEIIPRDLYYHEIAYVRRLEAALADIAGGRFEDASTLALAGDWQTMYGRLQTLASDAIKKENSK